MTHPLNYFQCYRGQDQKRNHTQRSPFYLPEAPRIRFNNGINEPVMAQLIPGRPASTFFPEDLGAFQSSQRLTADASHAPLSFRFVNQSTGLGGGNQIPLYEPPQPQFPERNRLGSGLHCGVVVADEGGIDITDYASGGRARLELGLDQFAANNLKMERFNKFSGNVFCHSIRSEERRVG